MNELSNCQHPNVNYSRIVIHDMIENQEQLNLSFLNYRQTKQSSHKPVIELLDKSRRIKKKSRHLDITHSLFAYLDHEELCSCSQQLYQEQALYHQELAWRVDRDVLENIQYMMMLSLVYFYLVIHSQLNF